MAWVGVHLDAKRQRFPIAGNGRYAYEIIEYTGPKLEPQSLGFVWQIDRTWECGRELGNALRVGCRTREEAAQKLATLKGT